MPKTSGPYGRVEGRGRTPLRAPAGPLQQVCWLCARSVRTPDLPCTQPRLLFRALRLRMSSPLPLPGSLGAGGRKDLSRLCQTLQQPHLQRFGERNRQRPIFASLLSMLACARSSQLLCTPALRVLRGSPPTWLARHLCGSQQVPAAQRHCGLTLARLMVGFPPTRSTWHSGRTANCCYPERSYQQTCLRSNKGFLT